MSRTKREIATKERNFGARLPFLAGKNNELVHVSVYQIIPCFKYPDVVY